MLIGEKVLQLVTGKPTLFSKQPNYCHTTKNVVASLLVADYSPTLVQTLDCWKNAEFVFHIKCSRNALISGSLTGHGLTGQSTEANQSKQA